MSGMTSFNQSNCYATLKIVHDISWVFNLHFHPGGCFRLINAPGPSRQPTPQFVQPWMVYYYHFFPYFKCSTAWMKHRKELSRLHLNLSTSVPDIKVTWHRYSIYLHLLLFASGKPILVKDMYTLAFNRWDNQSSTFSTLHSTISMFHLFPDSLSGPIWCLKPWPCSLWMERKFWVKNAFRCCQHSLWSFRIHSWNAYLFACDDSDKSSLVAR